MRKGVQEYGGRTYDGDRRVKCSCGKLAYDKKTAQTVLNKAHLTKRDKVPIRIYKCIKSGYWHLTSTEDSTYEDRQEKPLLMADKFRDIINKTE